MTEKPQSTRHPSIQESRHTADPSPEELRSEQLTFSFGHSLKQPCNRQSFAATAGHTMWEESM
jgi:hypothetical protein